MDKKESKGFVQLEWVCPNCDGRNPGPIKSCQSCGAPQPDNVQFQRAADEKLITDEKILGAAKAGADIHCGFCGTRNSGSAATCSQCGGDLKEGKARAAGQALQAAAPALKAVACATCGAENLGSARVCKECGAPMQRTAAAAAATPELSTKTPAQPSNGATKKISLGVFLILITACVALWYLFGATSKSVEGTVLNAQWQTSVAVQEIQPVNYSNQSGNPPSDAYSLSCRDETQEVCEDKTIDKGNGFAEVVKECHTDTTQYCDYTMDEWNTIQTYTLDGEDNSPVYESPSLTSNQRTGSTTEVLTVTFNTSDGQKTYSPGSVTEFQQFKIGSVWTIKLTALGAVIGVER